MSDLTEGDPNPETFHDIQDDASWAILRLTPILMGLYALSMGIIAVVGVTFLTEDFSLLFGKVTLGGMFVGGALFGAVVAIVQAVVAYNRSFENFEQKVGAQPLDQEDSYHRQFENIVEEITVASPVSYVRPMVVPSGRSNAMAVGDRETATIYITEGALGQLRRDELQALVAHEMAHIAYGDSRLKYFTSSIVQTFDWFSLEGSDDSTDLLDGHGGVGMHGRGRGQAVLAVIAMTVVSTCLKFVNRLLTTQISHEREWRADATAIEYCRDPLSLASALYKLGMREDKARMPGLDSYTSVFDHTMSSPSFESLLLVPFNSAKNERESASWFDRLFRSHPPLFARVEKALDLAHTPFTELQSRLDRERSSPHFPVKAARDKEGNKLLELDWFIHRDGESNPVSLGQLLGLETDGEGEQPLVATAGDEEWHTVEDDPELAPVRTMFRQSSGNHRGCPECGVDLRRRTYLGVPLEACVLCGGVLIPFDKIVRVQSRYVKGDVPEEIGNIDEYKGYHGGDEVEENEEIRGECPDCAGQFQTRRFQGSALYIDRCNLCGLTWFEEDELMISLVLN